jgi:hypothetical protein
MLLRASSEKAEREVDLGVVTGGARDGAGGGVPQGELLIAFAEATVETDDAALARARQSLLAALGPAALVDAAAVTSNFERMVRIADATGIPLDAPLAAITIDLRRDLGIDRYAAAAQTPAPSRVVRVLARLARPLLPRLMRLAGKSSRIAKR